MSKELGLDEEKIKEISKIKKEPKWMTDFRLKSYKAFKEIPNPNFGPELKIDFDKMQYDDPEVFKLISSGNTKAVFQLESGGFQKFMKELMTLLFSTVIRTFRTAFI